ncbi:hypothetical protein HYT45_00680 [Candidatus Uhrbacteria bacterium]|nr:hypothetical protein [Candidatus Uhrbacteria bacterium]
MNNLLKRLLELSKKTGDRIVFADIDGEDAHVVLTLSDYEELVAGRPASLKKENELKDASPKTETAFNKRLPLAERNALEEMDKEVIKALEAERAGASGGRSTEESGFEVEDRYFLEPIE